MKLALVSALLLSAHAASYSNQGQAGDEPQGSPGTSSTSVEAYGPLATQPGIPATSQPQASSAAADAGSQQQQQQPGNVTELVLQGLETVDTRVLAYGGGDPSSILAAAQNLVLLVQDLTRVLNGTQPDLQAAAAAGGGGGPITRESIGSSGGDNSFLNGGAGAATVRLDIEKLLRDINNTKWAFQRASICDVMYFLVGKIGDNFRDLLTTFAAQAPADGQAATNKTIRGSGQAFEQSQALLGPRYCANANGQGGPSRAAGNGSSAAANANPQLPPPLQSYKIYGSNRTATYSSSSAYASTMAGPAGGGVDAQPTQQQQQPSASAQATNDRAAGGDVAAITSAPAATAGAAGGLCVPAAAAWGFLLAVPGFLL